MKAVTEAIGVTGGEASAKNQNEECIVRRDDHHSACRPLWVLNSLQTSFHHGRAERAIAAAASTASRTYDCAPVEASIVQPLAGLDAEAARFWEGELMGLVSCVSRGGRRPYGPTCGSFSGCPYGPRVVDSQGNVDARTVRGQRA